MLKSTLVSGQSSVFLDDVMSVDAVWCQECSCHWFGWAAVLQTHRGSKPLLNLLVCGCQKRKEKSLEDKQRIQSQEPANMPSLDVWIRGFEKLMNVCNLCLKITPLRGTVAFANAHYAHQYVHNVGLPQSCSNVLGVVSVVWILVVGF